MNPIIKNGLLLAIFALTTTALVCIIFLLTEPAIKEAQIKSKHQLLAQIIPANMYDNDLVSSCISLTNQALGNNEPHNAYLATLGDFPSGIAIETTAPNGYSGRIELIVGLDMSGYITGVRTLKHAETPGLGDKIDRRKDDWVDNFVGYAVNGEDDERFAVRKDGGEFDQFTGATITPRAVVAAVKRTALYFEQNKEQIFLKPVPCEP